MPGNNPNRQNTVNQKKLAPNGACQTALGSGLTPERPGMTRPPRTNDYRYMTGGGSSSTQTASTAAKTSSWTEKQKIAA